MILQGERKLCKYIPAVKAKLRNVATVKKVAVRSVVSGGGVVSSRVAAQVVFVVAMVNVGLVRVYIKQVVSTDGQVQGFDDLIADREISNPLC